MSILTTKPDIQKNQKHLDEGVNNLPMVNNYPQQGARRECPFVRQFFGGLWRYTPTLRPMAYGLLYV